MNRLKYRPYKGLEIRCLKCNKTIHKDPKPHNGCKHPIEKTAYRAIVIKPNSGGKRITTTLKSRSYDDAVKELIDFRTDIENGIEPIKYTHKEGTPILLVECMQLYLDFLSDIGVPDHKKRFNSDSYIRTQTTFLRRFIKFLKDDGKNIDLVKITDISDIMVGKFHSYLMNTTKSNYSYNHHIKVLRSMYRYLIEKKKYKIENPFIDVKLKSEKGKDVTINADDFYALVNIISPIDAILQVGSRTKRNMYKDW